ncbi:MAG: GDP-mannose 4,6-dehydratase [Candidatus Levybacteria bacterium]|nr:GDP-mannose 4,6-dehydratase [Candidatus Levybacteria bacterium]
MRILITGGAGFIGVNTAEYFLKRGDTVYIYDNLSRKGSSINLNWLVKKYPKVKRIKGDLSEIKKLEKIVKGKDVIIHLAAQVAVTTSVDNPSDDFKINALGTFNILEAMRLHAKNSIFLYSSTNKVYGGLEDLKIIENKIRYEFINLPFGVSETQSLDFHSPYGCSKGAADQYVRDYSRIYGLKTVVFRQSCIYGPHQFGVEDQGWIAWFIIALLSNKKITIYGNGKQVRDILYIDDLIRAYDLAIKNIDKTKGQIYNIGGGYKNTLSVWREFRPMLERLFKRKFKVNFSKIRPGDQPIYISDIKKAKKDFGWEPIVSVEEGVEKLFLWLKENL